MLSNFFFMVVIGEVNRKRLASNQISYLWFTPRKFTDICNEYRRRYPEGRFLRYAFVCLVTGMVCLLASIVVFFYVYRLGQRGMSY